MSKKGQGLAIVSILVLIAILYFIFKYNTETYAFVMQTGDEQAHLVTAYMDGAKVKSYIEIAARDAAFETIWSLSDKSPDPAIALPKCTDANFQQKFETSFNRYVLMYAPSTDLIETTIPNYKFNTPFACSSNSLTIEGFGYDESCKLQKNFPFPELPCEDQPNATVCAGIKFTQNYPGNACTWNTALNCTDSLPEPDCTGASDSTACAAVSGSYCSWETSYSEKINVVSAPLANYQFSIDTDAHFIETISGNEYAAFADSRAKVV